MEYFFNFSSVSISLLSVTPDSTHKVEIPALLPKAISVSLLSPIIMHWLLSSFLLSIMWSIMNVLGLPIIYAFVLNPVSILAISEPAPGTL
jgi:nucleoside recognition membrane protein YjiH